MLGVIWSQQTDVQEVPIELRALAVLSRGAYSSIQHKV